jgi:hypothetical protein
MHKALVKLNTVAVTAAWFGLLACSSNAQATDSVQIGHFSVPGASQGWPYVAPTVVPAQNFTPNTTSDTTNPINWLNPASVANAGFNPNTLATPGLLGNSIPYGGSPAPYIGSSIPYAGSFRGGWGTGLGYSALSTIGGFGIRSIPYVGSFGSFGIPFVGRSLGGWGGGWGHGWSGYSSYLPFNYGGFGFGGIGNPASYLGGFGSSFHGTTPNRFIQTGPSPSSGNYYQPATADPSASGGYYASGSTAIATPAAQPTKSQPKSYYDAYGSDNNWGASGSPLPKDLNSVPWSK